MKFRSLLVSLLCLFAIAAHPSTQPVVPLAEIGSLDDLAKQPLITLSSGETVRLGIGPMDADQKPRRSFLRWIMEDYVEHVGDGSISVVAAQPVALSVVKAVNGVASSRGSNIWRIDYDSEGQLDEIFQSLIDAKIAFATGHGWPPSEIAEMLRAKGRIHGVIRVASWFGPNQQTVQEL
jgi:hypothetical protein